MFCDMDSTLSVQSEQRTVVCGAVLPGHAMSVCIPCLVAPRLADATAIGPKYPECCFETECQFQMSSATLIICHGLPPTTFELEREVECVLGYARQIWKRPIVMQR